jgi:hypothetical protein
MVTRHENIGKATSSGVRRRRTRRRKRKRRTENEKGNSWNDEKESRAGKESAGNTNGSLMWWECEGRVSQKKSRVMKMSDND